MKLIINTVTALIGQDSSWVNKKISLKYGIDVCMLSDVGCHRTQNEDSVLYIKPAISKISEQKGFLAIVADGMGGHQAGQVASQMAVELISQNYYNGKNNPLLALERSFLNANKEIFLSAQQDVTLKGMGTTCTALVLKNGQAYISHIGDSRLYLIRDKQIRQMTEDHTIVHELVKNGMLSPDEAEDYPHKNLVTRAMGTHSKVKIFIKGPIPIQVDDYFLLCSDGLYDVIKDAELKEVVLSRPIHDACKQLITLSKNRGGYDNISVGVVSVKSFIDEIQSRIPSTRF